MMSFTFTTTSTTLAIIASVAFAPVALATDLPSSVEPFIPEGWAQEVQGVDQSDQTLSTVAPWVDPQDQAQLLTTLALIGGNVSVLQAQTTTDQTKAQLMQTDANWLPSADANGSYQVGTPSAVFAETAGNQQYQIDLGVDVSLPLTPWSSIPTRRAAKSRLTAAEAEQAAIWSDAVVDVSNAWLDVVQAQESLVAIREQLTIAQELLTITESRYGNGSVTGLDVLQQRQQIASIRADVPAAEAELVTAQRALAALVRVNVDQLPDVPTQLPAASHPSLPSPDGLVANNPRVLAASADYEAARRDVAAAKANFAPTLAANAGAGTRQTQFVDDGWRSTWSAGVTASVPLFGGNQTRGVLRQQNAAKQQSLLALEQTVIDVVQQTQAALTNLDQAALGWEANQELLKLSIDSMEAATSRYSSGLTEYTAVLNASQEVRTARLQAIQAHRIHLDAALGLYAITLNNADFKDAQ